MRFQKRLLMALGSVTALSLSMPTMAIMSVPDGWYLEGNVGSSHLSNSNLPGNSSASGIGGNVNIGYKFMPFLGTEIGYTRYANNNITNSAGVKAAQEVHYSYDLALRGILPISDSGFEFFAKLGVDRINSTITIKNSTAANAMGLSGSQHTATGLYLGAGAQYFFMPEFAINAQWQRANGNNTTGTEDLLSLGFSFTFS